MSEFKAALPEVKPSRVIKLEEHNPSWKDYFEREKTAVESAFFEKNDLLVDVLHVGSTSVERLIAKPIIDMIVVVKDPYNVDQQLAEAGYKYKGEYNIPMRRIFGKKGDYEVYMHVYEEGNPEISLNLAFREFLKSNAEAREEYSALKISIVRRNIIHKTDITGITTYNLEKNVFIQRALNEAGFNGLCMRLCTQDSEWADYKSIRLPYLAKIGRINEIDSDQNKKHIVLVKGVAVVAAAQVDVLEPNAFIEFLGVKIRDSSRISLLKHLLGNIEKWIEKLGTLFVTTVVTKQDSDIFEHAHYAKFAETNGVLHMMKYLSSPDIKDVVNS